MQKRVALIVAGVLLLAGCSSTAPSSYPIATGPLKAEEIALANYGTVGLASRVFDVVNQDQAAASNTGLAGGVQPMPVDVLSSYAASKFRANGGPNAVRFVVKQGSLQVRAITPPKSSGWFSSMTDGDAKAELAVDLSVMVAATKADGTGASIVASTSQTQQTGFGGTPEDHRAVYLQLMARALAALDAEISRQLPTYFNGVIAR
jgi:hypothetical protein